MVVDKNDKLCKDIRTLEERNRQLESLLKTKQVELLDAAKRIS